MMIARAYRSSALLTVGRSLTGRYVQNAHLFSTSLTTGRRENSADRFTFSGLWSNDNGGSIVDKPAVSFKLPRRVREKVVTASDAVSLIGNGDTVAVTGFVAQGRAVCECLLLRRKDYLKILCDLASGAPEYVLEALGDMYRDTGHPHSLSLLFGGGPGDWDSRGLNHLAQIKPDAPGMLHRTIGSHYGQVPRIAKLVIDEQVEAWSLPMGSVSRMVRSQATHSPGYVTSVGLGTFVDPSVLGGAANQQALASPLHTELVTRVQLGGLDQLCYKALPVNVAIIRATTADPQGNLTMEDESLVGDHKITAAAARNSGGIVIAQVKNIAQSGSLSARDVAVPGALVDCVVVVPEAMHDEKHAMSYFKVNDPVLSCKVKTPTNALVKTPLDIRKVIARRSAFFPKPGDVVNLGIGVPEGVAAVAEEEGMMDYVTLTTEAGMFGGKPESGHQFGPARNALAVVEMNQMFDFYDGGGLDRCFLGAAQISAKGDVNVSRLSRSRLTGPGGFIDISQSTKNISFLCPFTAKGAEFELLGNGTITIKKEGEVKKFVPEVSEITFSGEEAVRRGQRVCFVTERAVFQRTADHDVLELIEIAPGIEMQRDILERMDFVPVISPHLKTMDPRIFEEAKMEMLEDLFGSLQDRCAYHESDHTIFVDLFGVTLNTEEDVYQLIDGLKQILHPLTAAKGPIHVVANYDGFDLRAGLEDIYRDIVSKLATQYYASVTRFAGAAFHRAKLGQNVLHTWDLDNAFDEFDTDRNGKLSVAELRHGMQEKFGIRLTESELKSLTDESDVFVRRHEFKEFMLRALKKNLRN